LYDNNTGLAFSEEPTQAMIRELSVPARVVHG